MRKTLDIGLAVLLLVLVVWRLTGIPVHEALGAGFTALVLLHLLLHPNLFARRRWFHTTLNVALFGAMAVSIVSGFAASKWLVPMQHAPGDYLAIHKLHDTSSHLVLLIAGLHFGWNWLRFLRQRSIQPLFRRLVPVGILTAVAAVSISAVIWFLPPVKTVGFVTPDGKIHQVAPPADFVRLRRDQQSPDIRRALLPLGVMTAFFLLSAVIGALVLNRRERVLQVGDQVVHILDSDRDADETGRDAEPLAVGRRN